MSDSESDVKYVWLETEASSKEPVSLQPQLQDEASDLDDSVSAPDEHERLKSVAFQSHIALKTEVDVRKELATSSTPTTKQKERAPSDEVDVRKELAILSTPTTKQKERAPYERQQSAVYRTASGPGSTSQQSKQKSMKRHHTYEIPKRTLTHEEIAGTIWRGIIRHLQENQISINHITPERFLYLMPHKDSTQKQIETFYDMVKNPMLVDSANLQTILRLERSTETGPPGLPFHSYAYVREFALTTTELLKIIELLTDESGRTFAEVEKWYNMVMVFGRLGAGETIRERVFTIRYVGVCQYPETPFGRHFSDIEKRTADILANFLGALKMYFPAILDNAKVFIITDATSSPKLHPKDPGFVDEVERVLIEFFGSGTLLNRQKGGYYADYVRPYEDYALFRDLGTNVWHRLHENATPLDMETEELIDTHFDDVQTFINENPLLTGGDFTDGRRNAAAAQAKANLYRGVSVVALLGKDITLEEWLGETTFFTGKSRSGHLVKTFLSSLSGIEAFVNNINRDDLTLSPDTKIPFRDLWPCLRHPWVRRFPEMFRDYLSILRPIVTVSAGKQVTGLIRANFQHNLGLGIIGSLIDAVGTATTQKYGTGADTTDSEFINIAIIHPGKDKYASQEVELRRVMDLSWMKVFLCLDIVLDYIDQHARENRPLPPRFLVCRFVLHRLKIKLEETPEGQAFSRSFDEAKETLKRMWMRNFTRHFTEFGQNKNFEQGGARLILDAAGRRNIAQLGFAEGKPDSIERQAHLKMFWQKDLPDLHLVHAREESSRAKWEKSLMGLHEGQSYFLGVISQMNSGNYLMEILRQCPAVNRLLCGLGYEDIRRELILKCGMWIKKNVKYDRRFTGVAMYPTPYTETKHMQGLHVGFSPYGSTSVRWRKSNGDTVSILIKNRFAISKSPSDSRQLFFTEHGLDIVDGRGRPLRETTVVDAKVRDATIPVEQMIARFCGPDLIELWEAVRVSEGHSVPDRSVLAPGVRDWGVRQEDGLRFAYTNIKDEYPIQNRPPHLADANYLLVAFLNQELPRGGAFRTWESDGGEHTLSRFIAFLRSPEYNGHPWALQWIGRLTKDSPEINLLSKNMPYYRTVTKKKDRRNIYYFEDNASRMGVKIETWFVVGPMQGPPLEPPPPMP